MTNITQQADSMRHATKPESYTQPGKPAASEREDVSKPFLTLIQQIETSSNNSGSRILPKIWFLDTFRREKLRADRSKSPLTLAVLLLDYKRARSCSNLLALVHKLAESVRETDTLGFLAEDVVGLIFPDTDESRARIVLSRMEKQSNGLILSVTTQVYPEELLTIASKFKSQQEPVFSELVYDPLPTKSPNSIVKRCFDLSGALVALLTFSPVFLVTALAIKITSPGSVIFRQIRVGHNFVPFVLYKFRSMHSGTDDSVHRQYVDKYIRGEVDGISQGDSTATIYKMTSDERITRVGEFIRKWSIDELPQLFNVLKGEMSLVGPRPPLPYEVERYESWHLRRILEVKPGMTGLWQVDGRSTTTFEEMVRLDLKYAREQSLRLDLVTLIRTIGAVVRRRGAV